MRLHTISGDQVVLLYDHTSRERPQVGDSYCIEEVGGNEALVVQVVALETFSYPSLNEVLMRQIMEDSYGDEQVQTFAMADNAPRVENLGLAIAKIRRRIDSNGEWSVWNGYLPSRNVTISHVSDQAIFRALGLDTVRNPLTVGTTPSGRSLSIPGRLFEKINIIAAMKGMGKSHLAKVLILQLMQHGMVSVVFDVNREYHGLPEIEINNRPFSDYDGLQDLPGEPTVTNPGTMMLSAGVNFRFTIEGFGRRAFIRMFEQFAPSENTRNVFEREVNQAFDRLDQIDLANRQNPDHRRQRPFVSIDYIRGLFNNVNEFVRDAIMDRLDTIESLHIFARTAEEGASFDQAYRLCAESGGAIIIDLARLTSRFGRETFVGATLDMVEGIRSQRPPLPFPFVFFEEAHLYASGDRIENLVTRARHLGVTSTFVTNMVTHLNETILRQVDNLFLLYMPHKDDVRHVAKSATTDEETVSAFAQRIERYHAMLVGAATANYPLKFRVDPLEGIDTRGRTRYAFEE